MSSYQLILPATVVVAICHVTDGENWWKLAKILILPVINIFFDVQFSRLLMAFYWFYLPMESLCLFQEALKIFLVLKRQVTFPWLKSRGLKINVWCVLHEVTCDAFVCCGGSIHFFLVTMLLFRKTWLVRVFLKWSIQMTKMRWPERFFVKTGSFPEDMTLTLDTWT